MDEADVLMATYTDTTTFQRDFFPSSTDAVFPRLVERSAEMAYARINSRLANVYTVPFVAIPAEVVAISDMLTKCYVTALQARRSPILPGPGSTRRESAGDACMNAEMWLDDLVAGRAGFAGVSATTAGMHTRSGYTPIFDLDSSTEHHPDPDLLDKIGGERNS